MAKAEAAYVVAGEREVRVSSLGRVICEAAERTAAVTKLMVAQYVADVGDRLLRVVGQRPTALERWPGGWREGMVFAVPIRDGAPGYGPQARPGDGFCQKHACPRGAGLRRDADVDPGRCGAPTPNVPTSCASASTRGPARPSPMPAGWR